MNVANLRAYVYLLPLMPIVLMAVLSIAYWLVLAAEALRTITLRKMVLHAGRVFGLRDVHEWLTEIKPAAGTSS